MKTRNRLVVLIILAFVIQIMGCGTNTGNKPSTNTEEIHVITETDNDTQSRADDESDQQTESIVSESISDLNEASENKLLAEGRYPIGETDWICFTITGVVRDEDSFIFTLELENKSDLASTVDIDRLAINGINLFVYEHYYLPAGTTSVENAEVPTLPILETYGMVPEAIHQMQWEVWVTSEETDEWDKELFTYEVDEYERQLIDVSFAAKLVEEDGYQIYVMQGYLKEQDYCLDLYVVNNLDGELIVDITQIDVNGVTYQLAFGVELFPYGQTMVTLRLYEKELAKIGLDAETIDKAVFHLTIIKMTNGMQEWNYEAEWNK